MLLEWPIPACSRTASGGIVTKSSAVGQWVSRVDPGAVRNTSDIDLLVRRDDFDAVNIALSNAGFVHRHTAQPDLFLDGPDGRPREAVHLVFAREFVRPGETLQNPNVTESEAANELRVLALEALVQIKLTAFRDKDRVHLRDLLEVGLIDANWTQRYPPELAERFQLLIDTPDG